LARQRNQLRIIGGEYGGRRLNFPDGKGLRPTTDRVRETLFNWLQGEVAGKRALDLFAGSGALGVEALSRHAAEVVFVEKSKSAARQLRDNLQLLKATDRARVHQADALRWLTGSSGTSFDLIFLDPPFADKLLEQVFQELGNGDHLAPNAWIYVEQDSSHDWPGLPDGWVVYREGKAGQAAYRLLRLG